MNKELWARLNRNLTPKNDGIKRTEHVFISFKTNPDEPKAQELASQLEHYQLKVVPLHGGERCPFKETQRNQAINWIHTHLEACVAKSHATVVVATAASMKSQWVYHEYTVAAARANVVFLLWFDGDDPLKYFVPAPTWLMRRSPSCPVYLLDLRDQGNASLKLLAAVLEELPRWKRRRLTAMCKATLWYVPLVILAVCFVMLAVQNAKALESDVERAQAAERVKAVLGLGLSGLVAAAAVFLPWAYRLPRELAQYERFKLVVKGCGIHRYAILFMSPFADGIIAAPFYSVFAILFGFIVAGVRKLLTWRVIRRLDERGIPFGLDS